MRRAIAAALSVTALFWLGLNPAGAQRAAEEGPIQFTADEVTHDRELGIIRASGNVEASRDGQVLLADTITYNQKLDVVSASGNVSLLQPDGAVIFANLIELTGDFKDGILRDLRVRLADNARFAAAGARRSGGNVLEMRNAAYSPCESCPKQPERPPLWQLKARKIVHDETKQVVEYRDAWMEFLGVPVAYTPYFYHPDPTVKRRSGFLTPSFGGSSTLGTTVSTPYYIAISPSRDFTITPTLTAKERAILAGEYRERFAAAELRTTGNLTFDSEDEFRGHIDAAYREDISNTWRGGVDLQRSSDDTYLRRYNFSSAKTLTSRGFAEGFRGRNYMALNAYAFQGLQENDDPGTTPLVLPMFEYQHVGNPNRIGAFNTIDASVLALTRSDGRDTRRASLGGAWNLPFRSNIGDRYLLSLKLRGDLYHVDHEEGSAADDGVAERIYTEANLGWRLPLSRHDGNFSQILEPIASIVVSPYGGNPVEIPNEDSVDVEFDDTNLFSSSRFTGIDRVEGGPRMNYGLKWSVVGLQGGGTSVFVGQSYRLKDDATFSAGTGLDDNLSDIVARVDVTPGKYIDLGYRTRLDKDNHSPSRNELALSVGSQALNASVNYAFFEREQGSEFGGREELSASARARLSRYWRTNFSSLYDVEDDALRSVSFGIVYECDCFDFDMTLRRTLFEDRDLGRENSILIRLTFETLGEVRTGVLASGS